MSVRKPSDLGYSDEGYNLPPLEVVPMFVETDAKPDGLLFWSGLKGITERSEIRRKTLIERVLAASEMANDSDEQWLIWCGLNDESAALVRQIPDAVEVKGQMPPEEKARPIERFQDGEIRVLVTKPKIAGFGMNFQNCHRMAFVGLSDSWEAYYQCIQRCYRFGQTSPVKANIVPSEAERPIYDNVIGKHRRAEEMRERLVEHVREFEKQEITEDDESQFTYSTATVREDGWTMMLGDSVERLGDVESDSVGLSVFSPPFLSLYTYSATERDLGNSQNDKQFFTHLRYIISHLHEPEAGR